MVANNHLIKITLLRHVVKIKINNVLACLLFFQNEADLI